MANSTNETIRPLAVLNLPRPVHDFIAYATNVVKAMTANPAFPTPAPALATVMAAVVDLRDAEAAAAYRIPDAIAARDARRAAVGVQEVLG